MLLVGTENWFEDFQFLKGQLSFRDDICLWTDSLESIYDHFLKVLDLNSVVVCLLFGCVSACVCSLIDCICVGCVMLIVCAFCMCIHVYICKYVCML